MPALKPSAAALYLNVWATAGALGSQCSAVQCSAAVLKGWRL